MLQFSVRDLLLLTAWLALCAALFGFGSLNWLGIALLVGGVIMSLLALALGRLGTALVLLAALAVAFWAFDRFRSVCVADGHSVITLGFTVVDTESTEPLVDATVAIRDLDLEADAGLTSPIAVGRTDSEGNAILTKEFPITVRDTVFTSRYYLICSRSYRVVVSRKGYEAAVFPLTSKMGDGKPANQAVSVLVPMRRLTAGP